MCLIHLSNSHEGTSDILTLNFIVYGLNVYTVIISPPVIHLGIYHYLMLINNPPPNFSLNFLGMFAFLLKFRIIRLLSKLFSLSSRTILCLQLRASLSGPRPPRKPLFKGHVQHILSVFNVWLCFQSYQYKQEDQMETPPPHLAPSVFDSRLWSSQKTFHFSSNWRKQARTIAECLVGAWGLTSLLNLGRVHRGGNTANGTQQICTQATA